MLHQARVILALFALGAAPSELHPVTDKTFDDVVLKPHEGKAVLVAFWASYCEPCLRELPALLAMRPQVRKAGGDIVLVNVDGAGDTAQIKKVLKQKHIKAFDGLQVQNEDPQPFIDHVDTRWMGEVPFAAVYGKDGKLAQTFSGEQKPEDLKRALAAASAPSPAAPSRPAPPPPGK